MRMERNYSAFLQDIGRFIPRDRLFTDELHRLAWGTDAGFYRLIPQIVIHSINDDEVIEIIYLADRYNIPVTFRAAGTSLSGQAISDSVLIIAWKRLGKLRTFTRPRKNLSGARHCRTASKRDFSTLRT